MCSLTTSDVEAAVDAKVAHARARPVFVRVRVNTCHVDVLVVETGQLLSTHGLRSGRGSTSSRSLARRVLLVLTRAHDELLPRSDATLNLVAYQVTLFADCTAARSTQALLTRTSRKRARMPNGVECLRAWSGEPLQSRGRLRALEH